ncbi:hypothetical protein [Lysobacter sp. P5_B9]
MNQLSASTAARLNRALIAAAIAFVLLILMQKFGIHGRPLRIESPASWASVARNIPSVCFLSALVGAFFFFFPRASEQ